MMQCSAENAGLAGCQAPVQWVIKAVDRKLYACGRHLNRVCLQMARIGVAYMTLALEG